MVAINTMAEMIIGTIVGIGQCLFIIIITMNTLTDITTTAIGLRGNHGSIIKRETPTMRGMVITRNTITNCFSYSMMA
jgi:hypothetical protein